MKGIAPKRFDSFLAKRANCQTQRVLDAHGIPAIASALIERHGAKVLSGPFAGMKYIDKSAGSSLTPKLVGSYENELHGVLSQILANTYDTVVDVGCAEGYYAVGLAMRLGGTPAIYAYDTNRGAQAQCSELLAKNSAQNKVIIAGFCDSAKLQSIVQGRALVFCDCEGYEIELLQTRSGPLSENYRYCSRTS